MECGRGYGGSEGKEVSTDRFKTIIKKTSDIRFSLKHSFANRYSIVVEERRERYMFSSSSNFIKKESIREKSLATFSVNCFGVFIFLKNYFSLSF